MDDLDIRLKEMNDQEFTQFLDQAVLNYSKILVKSGRCSKENAVDCSHKQFQALLPRGKDTKDNYIYKIVRKEKKYFGHVWYRKHDQNTAFICDLLITETFRRQGYGKQTLGLVEMDAMDKGFHKIFLHLVQFNKAAVSLYEVSGYKTIPEQKGGAYMVKAIV